MARESFTARTGQESLAEPGGTKNLAGFWLALYEWKMSTSPTSKLNSLQRTSLLMMSGLNRDEDLILSEAIWYYKQCQYIYVQGKPRLKTSTTMAVEYVPLAEWR